ncbi:hypothetical protein DAPPUDRAFT_328926 [Daphnia pulex]|uniref:Uncharacterized protein n=1 Tax=Daphnia pulex TaxID=6669 RepID=E9HF53_DAPPU|nr:hypothetical protein DAPPUDRAFT_328926 [Daphnia pulex]|eukprot:EFX69634.1 hypothetical protein DAPPUDRAFT_328926 [Daphnia pulex]
MFFSCDSIHHELGPFCFDNERLANGTQSNIEVIRSEFSLDTETQEVEYFSDDILPDCTDLSSEQQFEEANSDKKEVEETHVPILEVESLDAANELAQNVYSSENETLELLEGGACGDLSSEQQFEEANSNRKEVEETHVPILEVEPTNWLKTSIHLKMVTQNLL